MSVFHILEAKSSDGPSEVVSVEATTSVSDAVALMSKHRIGAVLVRQDSDIAGILSERDVMHLVARSSADALAMPVSKAMTKKLVFEAAARGADLYITGQWRAHAEEAVRETGIGVITVGHERSEMWGLKLLARLLEEEFVGLKTFVF